MDAGEVTANVRPHCGRVVVSTEQFVTDVRQGPENARFSLDMTEKAREITRFAAMPFPQNGNE